VIDVDLAQRFVYAKKQSVLRPPWCTIQVNRNRAVTVKNIHVHALQWLDANQVYEWLFFTHHAAGLITFQLSWYVTTPEALDSRFRTFHKFITVYQESAFFL